MINRGSECLCDANRTQISLLLRAAEPIRLLLVRRFGGFPRPLAYFFLLHLQRFALFEYHLYRTHVPEQVRICSKIVSTRRTFRKVTTFSHLSIRRSQRKRWGFWRYGEVRTDDFDEFAPFVVGQQFMA
jgi:hypothetical protein